MKKFAVAAAAVLLASAPAMAADPVGVPSGFYFGGHVGYGFGNATATLGDPIGMASAGGTTQYGMLFGGVQAGYQQTLPSRWMWGVELDLSFANYMDLQDTLSYRADRHRHGQRAARIPGNIPRPAGLRHGALDAVRDRRRCVRQHALCARPPYQRQ